MTWYSFTGNDTPGHPIQGRYDVRDNNDPELILRNRLHSVGITNISIKKLSFLKICWMRVKRITNLFFPVSQSTVASFYYQLADMLEVGVPLKNALFVIASHLNNPKFSQIIHDIISSLSRGLSFSEALNKHTRLFPEVIVRLISFAQSKEELIAMLRYCDQSMRRLTFFKKLFFVVIPQLSVMLVLLSGLFFLRLRYLPDFNYAIFVFRKPTPMIIHYFDFITSLFTVHLLRTICIALFVFFGCKWLFHFSRKLRLFYHAILCYFPVFSGLVLSIERERLSLLYSVLLKGGSSVQKCAQYSAAVVKNIYFQRRVRSMFIAVNNGEAFSKALKYFRVFSPSEIQMIALGSLSNSLVKTFERLYVISQVVLERKLLSLIEFIRLGLYLFNTALFFFTILVAETLFFYSPAG